MCKLVKLVSEWVILVNSVLLRFLASGCGFHDSFMDVCASSTMCSTSITSLMHMQASKSVLTIARTVASHKHIPQMLMPPQYENNSSRSITT